MNIETTPSRIAVIILNYNNYEDTTMCLNRIVGIDSLDIILVDNSSPDGSGDRLAADYRGRIHYIQTGRNAGYAAGNNVGIKYAVELGEDRFICILNNDTLPEPELFGELACRLDKDADCGIVGPVILENGPIDIIQSAGADINLAKGHVPARHHGERYVKTNVAEECAYVGGACMMFRACDISSLGYIPETYFLFYEETEWCLCATRKGMKVLCDWNCSLIHTGSATISKHKGLASYFNIRNKALFEKRNASRLQRAYFLAYQTARIVYRRVFKRDDCVWEMSAICDGLRNRVGSEFSNLDIIHNHE